MATVNAAPLPAPKPYFEDPITGVPASGYKLFSYVAGSTNTKQNTYTDYTGGVANTNPIVLNSAGQPSTQVWLTAGQRYKFILASPTDTDPPSSGTLLGDYISGINDVTASASEWQPGPTPTYVSATQFTLVGDQTGTFTVNRRIQATVTAGTVYGYVSASVFGALTTVTVVLDSGALDSGLSAVSYGLLASVNPSVPQQYVKMVGTTLPIVATSASITSSQNGQTTLTIANPNAGGAAGAGLTLTSDAGSHQIIAFSNASSLTGDLVLAAITGKGFRITDSVLSQWTRFSAAGQAVTGTVNATTGFQYNGTALPFQKLFTSSDQVITAAGALTLAHGLSTIPTLLFISMVCQTGEGGYTAGDVAPYQIGQKSSTALDNYGCTIVPDGTNLNVRYGSGAGVFPMLNKTTGASFGITPANWKVRFYAASIS